MSRSTRVTELISGAYDGSGTGGEVKAMDLESEDSAPVIQLANRIVEDAYIAGASDIHIEPMEKDLLVRYRIDGMCQEKLRLPKQVTGALVARLKIMCNLDISEAPVAAGRSYRFQENTRRRTSTSIFVSPPAR